jgi:hypothetical protein
MAISAGRPTAPAKLGGAVEIAVVAFGAVIAVGVTVLFLALIGASRTSLAARQQSSGSTPVFPVLRHRGATNSSSDPPDAGARAEHSAAVVQQTLKQ